MNFFCVFCFSTLITGVVEAILTWNGGSGRWNNESFWSLNRIPRNDDIVSINLLAGEAIWIEDSVQVAQLHFNSDPPTKGFIYLSPNVVMTVTQNFSIGGGSIITYQPFDNITSFSSLALQGSTYFLGSQEKAFKYLNISQSQGSAAYWLGTGTILFTTATYIIQENAVWRIEIPGGRRFLRSDESQISFNLFPNKILNPSAHLIATNPVLTGVYDMIVSNVARIDTITSNYGGRQLYPLLVSQDLSATSFYSFADFSHNFPYGGNHHDGVYNTTIKSIDEDECAHLCRVNYYKWCQSFDYYAFNSTCLLSKYRLNNVGGLYPITSISDSFNHLLLSTPWLSSHYERRFFEREIDSYIINHGKIEIYGENDVSSALITSVNVQNYNAIELGDLVNATFQRNLRLSFGSYIRVGNQSALSVASINSSLLMSPKSRLFCHSTSLNCHLIIQSGSNHRLEGGSILNFTSITINQAELFVNSSDVPVNDYFVLQADHFQVSEQSIVSFNNPRSKLIHNSMNVLNTSQVNGRGFDIFINQLLKIDTTSSVSTSGRGYKQGEGPGAGSGYSLGGSGGSYGGRGGVGKVDSTGLPYGSVIWPASAGSGGGNGYYLQNTGGAGGNCLTIQAGIFELEGSLLSNGNDGKNGGGGGSGGSIALNCSEFSGRGIVSASGGDGGYAGGVIAGGGGSGGRIAIHCSSSYLFNGTFDCSGGFLQPTYDVADPEQAGPGTIFLSSKNFQTVVVSNASVVGYLSNLIHNSTRSLPSLTQDTPLSGYRGAYLLPETDPSLFSAFPLHVTPCRWKYHVIGLTSIFLSRLRTTSGPSSYCLNYLLGSGLDANVVIDNSSFSLNDPTNKFLTVANIGLHLKSLFQPQSIHDKLEIQNDGIVYLYEGENSFWTFREVRIQSNGAIYFMNTTFVTTNQSLTMQNISSSLIVLRNQTLYFKDSAIYVAGGTFSTPFSQIATSSLAALNPAFVVINRNSTLKLTDQLRLQEVVLSVFGELYLYDGATIFAEKIVSSSQIIIKAGGRLIIAGNDTTVAVPVIFESSAILIVQNSSSVAFLGGGIVHASAEWSLLEASSTIKICQNLFLFQDGSEINGANSSIIIEKEGILRPQSTLAITTPRMIIRDGGQLSLLHNVNGWLYKHENLIILQDKGILDVKTAVNATFSNFLLDGGQVSFDTSANSATITFRTAANPNLRNSVELRAGVIRGNGTVIIDTETTVSLHLRENVEVTTSSSALTILQSTIINRGKLISSQIGVNGTLTFAQHASLENFNLIEINAGSDTQTWRYSESLYGFQSLPYKLADIPSFASLAFPPLYNISIEECAYRCVHSLLDITSEGEAQRLYIVQESCESFLYQATLVACQLLASTIEEHEINHLSLAAAFGWNAFNKNHAWIVPSVFTNYPTGVVSVGGSGTALSLDINVVNRGGFFVGNESSVIFRKQVLQSSEGQLQVNGSLRTLLNSGNSNNWAGIISGHGTIVFSSTLGIQTSVMHYLINPSIISPSLALEIEKVAVVNLLSTNLTTLSLKELFIRDEAELRVSTQPLHLITAKSIFLTEKSKIATSDSVITSDQCTTCFDLKISTPSLILSNQSRIDVSHAIISVSGNLTVDTLSSISCTGRGYSQNYSQVLTSLFPMRIEFLGGTGGSHGGFGGRGYLEKIESLTPSLPALLRHHAYGLYYEAVTWGQGGSLGRDVENALPSLDSSKGGGRMTILVSNVSRIDGSVSCDGSTPFDTVAGGGAGGSLIFSTPTLLGSGSISSRGGSGGFISSQNNMASSGVTGTVVRGRGGGGGGGRIVLFVDVISLPSLFITAAGGVGFQSGSAGTIYVNKFQAQERGISGGQLIISNTNSSLYEESKFHIPPLPSVLAEIPSKSPFGPLDSLSLNSFARVVINGGSDFQINENIKGDGSGTLILMNGTILTSFSLDKTLYLQDVDDLIILNAQLNCSNLHLTQSTLSITLQGSSTRSSPGTYSFFNASLIRQSSIRLRYRTALNVTGMIWRYSEDPIAFLIQDRFIIDSTSNMNSDGEGYTSIDTTPLPFGEYSCNFVNSGTYDNSLFAHAAQKSCGQYGSAGGGGGAYGGNGADGFDGFGGKAFGSLFLPKSLGVGGGNCFQGILGGSGGGAMFVTANKLLLSGRISVNGVDGSNVGAGGGSGGSIILRCGSFSHYSANRTGSIEANGGKGVYSNIYFGGGGSGGRVVINCGDINSTFSSIVNLTAYGGSSLKRSDTNQYPVWNQEGVSLTSWLNSTRASRASSGTVIVQRNSTVHDLYVQNDETDSDVITLTQCHSAASCQTQTTRLSLGLMDNFFNTSFLTLSSLSLRNMKIVVEVEQVLTISEGIFGNSGSEVHVYGTLILPDLCTIRSVSLVIFGQLLGAEHLTLENSATLTFYPNATWNSNLHDFILPTIVNRTNLGVYDNSNSSVALRYVVAKNLTLLSGSQLKVKRTESAASSSSEFRTIFLFDSLIVSLDSTITADGEGYYALGKARTTRNSHSGLIHPEHQASGNISFGDGGWAAGRGGGYYYTYPVTGNSLYPIAMGTAGGSTYYTSGNSGGGAIHLIVRDSFLLNGSLSADGQGCLSSEYSGGGGSGGSVWLEVFGTFTGNGAISARGGRACTAGGAGSGGRIAIYTENASLPMFFGSLEVGGGSQSSNLGFIDGHKAFPPAGGTIVISNIDYRKSSHMQLITSNNGVAGSPVYFSTPGQCDYYPGTTFFELESIAVTDVNLYFSGCKFVINDGIRQFVAALLVPQITVTNSFATTLVISGESSFVFLKSLSLGFNTQLSIQSSQVHFFENITLSQNARLEVNALDTFLVGWNASTLSAILETFSLGDVLSRFAVPRSSYDELPYLLSSSLQHLSFINAEGIILFNQTSLVFSLSDLTNSSFTFSNILRGRNLLISSQAFVSSAAIIQNNDWNYYEVHTALYQTFPHLGPPSGSNYAAGGGGNAGRGSAGSNTELYGSGRSAENLFLPQGAGGPGGNDVLRKIYGGGGGGGLLLQFDDEIFVDGLIDVSGGSASLNSSAGGGAGGSLFMYSPLANLRGSGRILSNGGNGSVSAASTFHSGAGSGGFIHLLVCNDSFSGTVEAKGGISVKMPLWLSSKAVLTTAIYQKALGLSSLANGVTNFAALQEIISAASGVVTRNSKYKFSSDTNWISQCSINMTSYFIDNNQQMDVNEMILQAWALEDLLSESSSLASNIRSSILYSPTRVPNFSRIPTFLPLQNHTLSRLKLITLICEDTNLNFTGTGVFFLTTLSANEYCTLSFSNQVLFAGDGSNSRLLDSVSIYFYDQSTLAPGDTLTIQNSAKLFWLNNNISSYPMTLNKFIQEVRNITFRQIIISDRAAIYGPVISIYSMELIVQQNSTISSTGYGHLGSKSFLQSSPTQAQGEGFGGNGDIGGNGGSYGGYGLLGLSNLYVSVTANQYIGLTNEAIAITNPQNTSKTYGNLYTPFQPGSGGGACSQELGFGGNGGGVIYLNIENDIFVDETSSIEADGQSTYYCGGGGSGGSLWIRHHPFDTVQEPSPKVVYSGHVLGSGKITANGGKTCPYEGCVTDIEYPGGAGGGGRIRVEKVLSLFTGTLSALSGLQNHSALMLETKRLGTLVRVPAITTLILNQTSDNLWFDIRFLEAPIFPVQIITTSGQGTGSREANNSDDAVVKGHWVLSYRSKVAYDQPLSSQATTARVKEVLQSLNFPELKKISVSRRPSINNGWSWYITFYEQMDRVVPIAVDPTSLWCTEGVPTITVEIINNFEVPFQVEDFDPLTDSPANFSSNELHSLLQFSYPVISNISYAQWINAKVLRVFPNSSVDYQGLVEKLYLVKTFPTPTRFGNVVSLSPPYLLRDFEPQWNFPTGQPSSQPSMQPTSQPSSQPSNQPTAQPTSFPSTQPTSIPSGKPSGQPSGQPSSRPSTQPSGFPTSQPSSQPSSLPSTQPTSQPSSRPSSQPSSVPTTQPTTQPSAQPSQQPISRPTGQPTTQPSGQPSRQPTSQPTGQPSRQPTAQPSRQPISNPTGQPTAQPVSRPTGQPSSQPSSQPTAQPFSFPTGQPSTQPSSQPTAQPSSQPSGQPTQQPISRPTGQPTTQPTSQPTAQPVSKPSLGPTAQPSSSPSGQPTSQPSNYPSTQPTSIPTGQPSGQPTGLPSTQPTGLPSMVPSSQPTSNPTQPTGQPTSIPTNPSSQPTAMPTNPTSQPSTLPTSQPSSLPSSQPSSMPTSPSGQPTSQPSALPSSQPTSLPTSIPSTQPSSMPSAQPSSRPSSTPSSQPTRTPSSQPTTQPTSSPTDRPTTQPTVQPTSRPSKQPTSHPTGKPSRQPTSQPSAQPFAHPTTHPSSRPSVRPSSQPSLQPSSNPSGKPSSQPSAQPSTCPTTFPSALPTGIPSVQPSGVPSSQPTSHPTQPTSSPSSAPSSMPSFQPTSLPTSQPSSTPSSIPSAQPSSLPSSLPTTQPSAAPSRIPSALPSGRPSSQPTSKPSQPSSFPSSHPTCSPSTRPTQIPSSQPTAFPSSQPSCKPTSTPTYNPTGQPSTQPSSQPSNYPTNQPTSSPTLFPTTFPSVAPSAQPTHRPSNRPSSHPSTIPSSSPSSRPSIIPTSQPIANPTTAPSGQPSSTPSSSPTCQPTTVPSSLPSHSPSAQPTSTPSALPSFSPTTQPSSRPTTQPVSEPTSKPSAQPSSEPSTTPTACPSSRPSNLPSSKPSVGPTGKPTILPTGQPTLSPTQSPTSQPSSMPTAAPTQPTSQPTGEPTQKPSNIPTNIPSSYPSTEPSGQPSTAPTSRPSSQPSSRPSSYPSTEPSGQPSTAPTSRPSSQPSSRPSSYPSTEPSGQPSTAPTSRPSSSSPTRVSSHS